MFNFLKEIFKPNIFPQLGLHEYYLFFDFKKEHYITLTIPPEQSVQDLYNLNHNTIIEYILNYYSNHSINSSEFKFIVISDNNPYTRIKLKDSDIVTKYLKSKVHFLYYLNLNMKENDYNNSLKPQYMIGNILNKKTDLIRKGELWKFSYKKNKFDKRGLTLDKEKILIKKLEGNEVHIIPFNDIYSVSTEITDGNIVSKQISKLGFEIKTINNENFYFSGKSISDIESWIKSIKACLKVSNDNKKFFILEKMTHHLNMNIYTSEIKSINSIFSLNSIFSFQSLTNIFLSFVNLKEKTQAKQVLSSLSSSTLIDTINKETYKQTEVSNNDNQSLNKNRNDVKYSTYSLNKNKNETNQKRSNSFQTNKKVILNNKLILNQIETSFKTPKSIAKSYDFYCKNEVESVIELVNLINEFKISCASLVKRQKFEKKSHITNSYLGINSSINKSSCSNNNDLNLTDIVNICISKFESLIYSDEYIRIFSILEIENSLKSSLMKISHLKSIISTNQTDKSSIISFIKIGLFDEIQSFLIQKYFDTKYKSFISEIISSCFFKTSPLIINLTFNAQLIKKKTNNNVIISKVFNILVNQYLKDFVKENFLGLDKIYSINEEEY